MPPSASMIRTYRRSPADPALDRRAIALVVRVADDARAGRLRDGAGAVGRSVVHHQDLVPRGGTGQRGHDVADDIGLVERRDHDGGLLG
jgi:hypothetical protein